MSDLITSQLSNTECLPNEPKIHSVKADTECLLYIIADYQNSLSKSRHRVLAIITVRLPKTYSVKSEKKVGYHYWPISISILDYKYILVY